MGARAAGVRGAPPCPGVHPQSSTALKTQSTQAIDNKVQFQSQYRPCHQTWRTRLNDLVMGRTIESGSEGSGGSQAEILSSMPNAGVVPIHGMMPNQ